MFQIRATKLNKLNDNNDNYKSRLSGSVFPCNVPIIVLLFHFLYLVIEFNKNNKEICASS